MAETLPIVLVPGLICSARIWAPVMPPLWRHGPVMVANHIRDDSMAAIARRILTEAPPRFALAGHSMGGYVALEVMRQAPERATKLALLDTAARADTPEQTERRRSQIAIAAGGKMKAIVDLQFPNLVHPSRRTDDALRRVCDLMADETGTEAFVRQQNAIIGRPDSRPSLAAIRCPTLVLVGDEDALTPPDRAREIAAAVRGSRLVLVPECGHLSTLERPQEVSRALREWLQ